jgi:hypothetical protein
MQISSQLDVVMLLLLLLQFLCGARVRTHACCAADRPPPPARWHCAGQLR